MAEQAQHQQTFWQRNRPLIIAAIITISIVFVGFVLTAYVFNWDWAGFNGGFSLVTTTSPSSGTSTVSQKPASKTFWDWLQLLIVPAILAIGGFWLNRIQKSREETAENQRAELARKAEDQRVELARKAEDQRAKLETQMDFMRRVRAMHVTIGYARDLLNAHQSAKTYGEQLRQLMQLRAEVEEISEDLGASPQLFREQSKIREGLEEIITYLNEAGQEYIHHHNHVDSGYKAGETLHETIEKRKMEWVQDFMEGGKGYKDKYIIQLAKAKGTMRSEVYGALQLLPTDASSHG